MPEDDESLIRKAISGDKHAYGQLVERHYGAAYASAYGVSGNASDAEEIAQETFVQAYIKLDRLREPKAWLGWIWRIARDLSLKRIRKHKRIIMTGNAPDLKTEEARPSDGLDKEEEKSALLAAIDLLPEDMRQAVQMKYWQGLSYAEMAERTGIAEGALYQRVCRGLKQLREEMGSDD
ncbi:MAG: RNA polymerase sigma factor [Planctomycetota bacterium]